MAPEVRPTGRTLPQQLLPRTRGSASAQRYRWWSARFAKEARRGRRGPPRSPRKRSTGPETTRSSTVSSLSRANNYKRLLLLGTRQWFFFLEFFVVISVIIVVLVVFERERERDVAGEYSWIAASHNMWFFVARGCMLHWHRWKTVGRFVVSRPSSAFRTVLRDAFVSVFEYRAGSSPGGEKEFYCTEWNRPNRIES